MQLEERLKEIVARNILGFRECEKDNSMALDMVLLPSPYTTHDLMNLACIVLNIEAEFSYGRKIEVLEGSMQERIAILERLRTFKDLLYCVKEKLSIT